MLNDKKAGNLLPEIGTYDFNELPLCVYGTRENPLFLAKAVINYLGLSNVTRALDSLEDDEKQTSLIVKSGQNRLMWFVNESGLYHLIFQSRKPEAKVFRRWVTHEVLPSIRRTGGYSVSGRADMPAPPRGTRERRIAPRRRSKALMLFFDELSTWTTHADDAEIALQFGVSADHVRRVARGQKPGLDVTSALVTRAMRNRERGIMREPVVSRSRYEVWAEGMCRLINKFMPLDGEEG